MAPTGELKRQMPTVTFHTLGCKLNFAESSSLRREFEERRYSVVPFGTSSDVTVINTCSVTAEADRKCRQVIRRAVRSSPGTCVIVTGCYAQLRPEAVAAIEGVDVVLGANEKARIFDLVATLAPRQKTQVEVSCVGDINTFEPALLSDDRTRAFLKIQDGCDYVCSFCTIPQARGLSRSGSVTRIVEQARSIASRGIREIVLTGVNIGLFGAGTHDKIGECNLLSLLQELARVEGIERYRISSIEPNLLTDEIIELVAATPTFVPHFHIPLQSGDDAVLGAMRRRYRRAHYASRVDYILKQMPDAAIGADVIVGFPAESDQRFENTRLFLEDLPLAYLHVFTYSERPNTTAVDKMELIPVSRQERAARNTCLRALSSEKRSNFARRFTGTVRPILWESVAKSDQMAGYTDNYIRLTGDYDADKVGIVEPVRIGSSAARIAHTTF